MSYVPSYDTQGKSGVICPVNYAATDTGTLSRGQLNLSEIRDSNGGINYRRTA